MTKRIVVTMLLALPLLSCGEGNFSPTGVQQFDGPFRFSADAPPTDSAAVYVMQTAGTTRTMTLVIRGTNLLRATGFVFDIAMDTTGLSIDSVAFGDFFQPATPLVARFAPAPDEPGHWIGVLSMTDLATGISGSGTLATVYLQRTTDLPLKSDVRMKAGPTRVYGQAGAPETVAFYGGSIVYEPIPAAP